MGSNPTPTAIVCARNRMSSGRSVWIMGDVHGQLEVLMRLLRDARLIDERLDWSGERDVLCFIGDLMDRGPGGLEAVELVMRLQDQARRAGGHVESLLGNHEVLLLAAHKFGGDSSTGIGGTFVDDWRQNGGYPRDLEGLGAEHIAWLSRRPAMAASKGWLLVHADSTMYISFGTKIEEVNAALTAVLSGDDPIAWDALVSAFARRNAFLASGGGARLARMRAAFGGEGLVHGHTPIPVITGGSPQSAVSPFVYRGGRCVNVDGGLFLGSPGFLCRLPDATQLLAR